MKNYSCGGICELFLQTASSICFSKNKATERINDSHKPKPTNLMELKSPKKEILITKITCIPSIIPLSTVNNLRSLFHKQKIMYPIAAGIRMVKNPKKLKDLKIENNNSIPVAESDTLIPKKLSEKLK